MIEAVLASYLVFAGTATDRLGDRFGGISSLRFDGERMLLLTDRGPGDGTVPYVPRFHVMEGGEVKDTIRFRDAKGKLFSGLIETKSSRLDSEGLAVDGERLWVAEEYGPDIHQFDRKGRLKKTLKVPEHYKDRVDNRGFEGLCLTPKGKLAAILQSPLKRDGGKEGTTSRLLLFEGDAAKEYLVELARPGLMFNELVALSETEFLLLERDGEGLGEGTTAEYKRLIRLELLEDGKTRRSEYLDLLPALEKGGFPAEKLPAKFESLEIAEDGSLWVATDNDFKPEVPTYIFKFDKVAK